MANKIITSDVYEISKRIKQIDDGYFIVYNFIKNRYEIHNNKQPFSSYCLTVPYSCLDKRTLDLVYKTLFTKKDAIFKQIEQLNNQLESEQNKKLSDETNYLLKKYLAKGVYNDCKRNY